MFEKLSVDVYYNDRLGCYLVLVSGASDIILEKRSRYIRFALYLNMERIFLTLFSIINFQSLSQDAFFQSCILCKD